MQISTNLIHGAKYIWTLPQVDEKTAIDLASSYNLSSAIIQTLLSRGFNDKEALDSYLFSTFEKTVTHASLLKDAQKAVDRIIAAIENKEKILICGDYDVDGVTSSAMMMACLLPLGAQINFFLPHRVKDGYGLSVKTVKKAATSGYKVLITVDNGITAFEAAQVARNEGLDLIITDHHKPHDHLPNAFAIINPHQADCLYPYKTFAGVGVTFKIISLLYEKLGIAIPSKVYELLLLGTVADVVPLTGENRYWVRHSLQMVNAQESLSLRVLKQNARVTKSQLTSLDIGFFLAPQINALGRLEDARQGVKFLLGNDVAEIEHVGSILKELNEARKAIEKSVFMDIQQLIDNGTINIDKERIILASSDNWPPGVIGLVASRLVAAYNRPVLLFHVNDKGIAKGSCRSIVDFNMFEALQENKDILTSFGGHAAAAGLSLPVNLLPELKERLEFAISKKIPVFEPKPFLMLDAEVIMRDVNNKLFSDLAYLEPFGNSNTQPIFFLRNVSVIDTPQLLKENHVKCMVFSDGIIKPVIFFNRPDLYSLLSQKKDESISLAVYVTQNNFNGKTSIEFQGLDVAL